MDHDPDDDEEGPTLTPLTALIAGRLDKVLADACPALSRSRLSALIAAGAVRRVEGGQTGAVVTDAALKVKPGEAFAVLVPPPIPATVAPEAISLDIVHEDAALIVVNKPSGMVVHPAPGALRGTLVAALLHHCGADLSGVGGVARPGVVHRIDKDTSGLLVVAKTDAAHAALSAQFAAHDLERAYLAVVWGAPDRADPRLGGLPGVGFESEGWVRVEAPVARHRSDRKRMAVVPGGRRAVTRFRVEQRFGPADKPVAALILCRLETGRTHQIRVHLAHVGHPLVGDPVYGRARSHPAAAGFTRQALHAQTLGFRHPDDGRMVRFERPPPPDFTALIGKLNQS